MHRIATMHRLLQIWPNMVAIAAALGVPYPTVACWSARGIPARRYAKIIEAAKAEGHTLTFEELAGLSSPAPAEDAA